MKLVAAAVVRDEADRYLIPWLGHLLSFCDEVRLLDDGSTDATVEIAAEYDPEVQILPNDGPSFYDNESTIRNRLLAWTMKGRPEYVLSIDADEFVGDTDVIRERVLDGREVYALTMREVWKVRETHIGVRVDGMWGDRRCPLLWKAPAKLIGTRWRIPNRKLACGREPLAVRRLPGFDTGVGIYHFGWTREAEREVRAQRYFDNDRGRFHADRHLQSILFPDSLVQLRWQPWPVSVPAVVAELAGRA